MLSLSCHHVATSVAGPAVCEPTFTRQGYRIFPRMRAKMSKKFSVLKLKKKYLKQSTDQTDSDVQTRRCVLPPNDVSRKVVLHAS